MPELQDDADDIGVDIRNAFKEQAEGVPDPVAAAVETPPEKPAVKIDEAGRVRDEHGKFTKAEAAPEEAAPAEKPKANEQAPELKAQQAAPAAAEKPPAIRPPASWSPEAKAAFLEAPPTVQQAMLKRNEEMEEGQKQWATKAESFNRLDKVLAPHRDQWALNGVTEDVAIAQLLAANKMLVEQPYQAIQYLARQFNVDLRRLIAPSQGQPANGQQALPDIGQHPLVQQLSQQVQTLTQTLAQRQQAEADTHRNTVLSEIEKFATDPEHIYFENVRPMVSAILKADGLEGKASAQDRLAAAYKKACRADDTVFGLIQAAEAKKKADAAKVKDARNASGSVNGTPIGGQQARGGSPSDDLDNDIRDAIRAHA